MHIFGGCGADCRNNPSLPVDQIEEYLERWFLIHMKSSDNLIDLRMCVLFCQPTHNASIREKDVTILITR